MQAKRGKIDPLKMRCDRCQQVQSPIWECSFHFRESYAHWKALWQSRTGKRLTNRRKKRLGEREEEQVDLRSLSDVVYWMDLCEPCWEKASAPWPEGFPTDFYTARLCNRPGQPFDERPSAKQTVPAKTEKPPRRGSGKGSGPTNPGTATAPG